MYHQTTKRQTRRPYKPNDGAGPFAALYVAAILAATLFLASLMGADVRSAVADILPRCSEDSVLLGAGDFEAGRWSQYLCGPAVDDYWPG